MSVHTQHTNEPDGAIIADGATTALDRVNRLVQRLPRLQVSSGPLAGVRQKLLNWLFGIDIRLLINDLCECSGELTRALNDQRERLSFKNLEGVEVIRREAEQIATQLRSEDSAAQQRLNAMDGTLALLASQVAQLDGVCRGLEGIISLQANSTVAASEMTPKSVTQPQPVDYSYVLLENRFRGTPEVVRDRLADYVPLFSAQSRPILEIGAGRGELQQLFRESGVTSYGLELDQAMVAICAEQGLDVRFENGIEHLRLAAPKSLGGVIAIQVVEHLPLPVLKEFLQLCARAVVPEGVIVLETINTSSLLALAHNYFRDPTHAQPLHPDTMRYLAEQSGLEVKEIRNRSPYPAEAQLQPVSIEAWHTPGWRDLIERYNSSIGVLNRLLFGFQDYALLASPRR